MSATAFQRMRRNAAEAEQRKSNADGKKSAKPERSRNGATEAAESEDEKENTSTDSASTKGKAGKK